jgi:hypothetical protein
MLRHGMRELYKEDEPCGHLNQRAAQRTVCQRRLGFNRTSGNGGLNEYFACLNRVSSQGRCAAPHFCAQEIERNVERKYKTSC